MYRIFISYSREDLTLVEKIEQALIQRGCSVWRDQESVYAGQNFPKAIGEAVANNDILVLIWSKRAHKAHFVEHEWTTALALKKPILPCMLDDTPLPPVLSPINGIIFKDVDDTVNRILKAVASESDSLKNQDKEQLVPSTQKRKLVTTAILVLIIGVALVIVQKVNEDRQSELPIQSNLDSARVTEGEFEQSRQIPKENLPMSITDEADTNTFKERAEEKNLEETDSTELYLASKREPLPKELSKLPSALAESLTNWRLIIKVSKEIKDFCINLDGEFKSTAHLCTLQVSEGDHTISVKYKTKLGHLYEYQKLKNITSDDSIEILKSEFTRNQVMH